MRLATLLLLALAAAHAPEPLAAPIPSASGTLAELPPPEFSSTPITTARENELYSYPVTATDSDGDPITLSATLLPAWLSFTDNGDGTGLLTGTPATSDIGTHDVTLEASDGTETAEQSFAIDVLDVNEAPVAVDDDATVPEDGSVDIDVLSNDSDPDAGTMLTVTAVSTPQHGTATANLDGTITYEPDPDYHGDDSFTYTVDDGDGPAGDPRFASAIATVSVVVTSVNDAPEAVDDTESTSVDTPVEIDVLANDSDPEGDPLMITAAGGASFGTVQVTGGGMTVTYTPEAGFNGQDSFSYVISDGNGGTDQATVTVLVAVTAPLARNDAATTPEDVLIVIDVLDNDESRVGGTLSVSSVGDASNGQTQVLSDDRIRYTPDADFFGTDSFVYTVSDAGGETQATVTVTVSPVQDAPEAVAVITPPSGATLLLAGDPSTAVPLAWEASSDADGDELTYRWELAATSAFSSVLLSVESASTSAQTTYGDLADALAAIGLDPGETIGVRHRVVAKDRSFEVPGPSSVLTVERGVLTNTEDGAGLPTAFAVAPAAPNPTRGPLVLALDLPETAVVHVVVYDALGRQVLATPPTPLAAGRAQPVELDLSRLGPGTYAYSLVAASPSGDRVVSGRATVAR